MKLATTIAAAAIVAGSAAFAQEAFITQLGDDNTGVNVSTGFGTGGNTQVIAQQGDNLTAGNLTNGNGNNAYAYQSSTGVALNLGQAIVGLAGRRTASSLIIQSDDDTSSSLGSGLFGLGDVSGGAEGNNALNVQLASGSVGQGVTALSPEMVAQTIQFGDGNTAINWQDNQHNAPLSSGFNPGITLPTLSLAPSSLVPPAPSATVGFPFGSSVTIN